MTDPGRTRATWATRRTFMALLAVVAVGGGIGAGVLVASRASSPGGTAAGSGAAGSGAAGSGAPRQSVPPASSATPAAPIAPTPTPRPTPTPSPTPAPTPVLVSAPLTGLPVTPEAAARHPIAVMIDDQRNARPQSGFNAASVVWQAPAEGGIPRYLLIFQDAIPAGVGPVRSARQYFIEWAAEWNAVYVHVGGSPQALATLRDKGRGQLVWNADEFRYGGTYLWRVRDRAAPHNVYTDGENLRRLAAAVGATDGPIDPAWTFEPGLGGEARPVGTTLTVEYPYETITYRYDAVSNTYRRFIDRASEPQVDRADGRVVAPSNVVILRMRFGALNDGNPEKHRLEAANIGSGEAIISTNGRIIRGTWSKASAAAPTLLFDADGRPVTLTAGQTFVQVIALSYAYEVAEGVLPRDEIGSR